MDIPVARVDDYTLSLIQEDVARFFPGPTKAVEPEEEESEVETKVVRRGRPPKPKANEDVETK
jgi:hypothetical protein